MPEVDIAGNYLQMKSVADQFLRACLGPQFTSTPKGHIQTDIAAACSLSGLMILQETVPDLSDNEPGIVILSDVHSRQNEVFEFMMRVVLSDGRELPGPWDNLAAIKQPMFECVEMTRRLAPKFYELCAAFSRPYYKFIAAFAGVKLVLAGASMGLLDPGKGKGLATYYVVAGSKTAPYPEALWPPESAATGDDASFRP